MDLGASILPRCTVRGDGTLPGQSWRPLPRQNSRTDLPARPSRQSTTSLQRSELPTPTAPHQWTEWTSQVPPRPVPSRAALNGVALGPNGTLLVPVLWHLYLHGRMRTHRQTDTWAGKATQGKLLDGPNLEASHLCAPAAKRPQHQHRRPPRQSGRAAWPACKAPGAGPPACLSATWASGRRRAKACLSTKCGSTHGGACCVWHWYVAIRGIQRRILRRSGVVQRLRRRHSSPCLTTTRAARAAQTAGTARYEYLGASPTVAQTNTCAAATHQSRVYSWRRWPAAALRCEREIAWGASPAQPSPVGVQWEGSGGRRGGV